MVTQRIDIEFLAKDKNALRSFEMLNRNADRFNKLMAEASVQNNRFATTMNRTSREVIKFNGNLLSTLFFGMQLQKTFGSALKTIFEGYKKIIPEGSEFNRLTTRLSANWEFFKFQLADAFAQSDLFQRLVIFAINLLQAFQKLPVPVKELIVVLLGIGTILGGLLFLVGVWGLGFAGVFNIITSLGTSFATLSGVVKGFSWAPFVAIGPLLSVVAALLAIAASVAFATANSETMNRKWGELGSAFGDLLNSILKPFNIEIKGMGELMILVAGVVQMFTSGVLQLGTALVGVIDLLNTGVTGAIRVAIAFMIDIIEAANEMWKAIRGEGGSFSGFDRLRDEVSGLQQSISSVLNTYGERVNSFGRATISFDEIQQSINEFRAAQNASPGAITDTVPSVEINIDGSTLAVDPLGGAGQIREAVNQILAESGLGTTLNTTGQ